MSVRMDCPSVGRVRDERDPVALVAGAISRAFSPLLSRQIDSVAKRTLTAFKYFVEHGEPPPGRHSRLPAAPAAC